MIFFNYFIKGILAVLNCGLYLNLAVYDITDILCDYFNSETVKITRIQTKLKMAVFWVIAPCRLK
jgi:hypothetical protein